MQYTAPPAPLLLIGGTPDGVIPAALLQSWVDLSGGPRARLAIVTSPSRVPLSIGPRYAAFLAPLCADVRVYHLLDRATANSPGAVAGLDQATGIFISGGEQLLATTRLGATLALDIIRRRHAAGATLAGTSAGASVMSSTMIAFGQEGATPMHSSVALAPGFGVLPATVIDQHFSQRNRLGRLSTAVLYNPEVLGVGIDENTAALFTTSGRLEVRGAATVTLIDGSHLEATDAADVEQLDVPLTSSGLQIHRLSAGMAYDLQARRIVE